MSIWIENLKQYAKKLDRIDLCVDMALDMLKYVSNNHPSVYGDALIFAIDKNQNRIDKMNEEKEGIGDKK